MQPHKLLCGAGDIYEKERALLPTVSRDTGKFGAASRDRVARDLYAYVVSFRRCFLRCGGAAPGPRADIDAIFGSFVRRRRRQN